VFISSHRKLPGGGRSAMIVINTYNTGTITGGPTDESALRKAPDARVSPAKSPVAPKKDFRVNRFEDLGL